MRDGGLGVGETEVGRADLIGSHAAGGRQVFLERGDRLGALRVQIGEERFCLAAKMIEIGAGRKLLFHNSSPWKRPDPQTGDTKNE